MTVGIIAEYNPFHNGHLLQIEYAKKTLKAEHIVVALSPDFTQRGEMAILSKYERTRLALMYGVDLVIQIPVNAATDSSMGYAFGAVTLLDSLGVVDTLLFSAEDDDTHIYSVVADIELSEDTLYKDVLRAELKSGHSYPAAREEAIVSCMPKADKLIRDIISKPNNILAIEYIKALKRIGSKITPICMKRQGQSYNDTIISGPISSASAVRCAIYSNDLSRLQDAVPSGAYNCYQKHLEKGLIIHPEDASPIIGYKLMQRQLDIYKDCDTWLSNKIYKEINNYTGLGAFISQIKDKNITYARISRVLCHILLNITSDLYIRDGEMLYPIIPYIYVLGVSKNGKTLLSAINNNAKLDVYTSLKCALDSDMTGVARSVLDADLFATNVYNMVLSTKSECTLTPELSRRFLVVE